MNDGGLATDASLRDWFAGQAITGLLAAGEYNESREGYPRNARDAYEIADAMLAAREREEVIPAAP